MASKPTSRDERDRSLAEAVAAARSARLTRIFARYLNKYFARSFNAVRLLKPGAPEFPPDRPLVFYSNHSSWWDPILYIVVGWRIFGDSRTGYGPMDAEALKKYGFMRRLGMFPVEADSRRGAVDFLAISRGLLHDPNATLWLTPQGRFSDPRERPVGFRPGIAHLARDLPDVCLVPIAIEYPFWIEKRPEALMHMADPIDARAEGPMSVGEWNDFLERRLESAMDRLAAASMARDEDRFEAIITGADRVSFTYDAWRWLKAKVRGRSFSAAHGERRP